jgi:integrase
VPAFREFQYPTVPLMAIEKFIKPAVGDTSLTRLAQAGGAPVRAVVRGTAGLPAAVQGTDVHRASHASGARVGRAVRARPLSVSSVRECHAVLSGALNAAMRWGWIAVNPLEAVKRPRQQHPQPDPPSAGEAARIVSAAWEQDADWGTLIWLTFITGDRRGELLGLAWEHLHLPAGLRASVG